MPEGVEHSGSEHIHERLELPTGLSAREVGDRLRERYDECLAADVAALLVQGFTLDQIEIEHGRPEVIDGRIRVEYRAVGRRAVIE